MSLHETPFLQFVFSPYIFLYVCGITNVRCTWLHLFAWMMCVCVCVLVACVVRADGSLNSHLDCQRSNFRRPFAQSHATSPSGALSAHSQTEGDGSRWLFLRVHAPGPSISLCCAAFQPDRLSLRWAAVVQNYRKFETFQSLDMIHLEMKPISF